MDEAQAYLDELCDLELDSQQLKSIASGGYCPIATVNACDDYVHPNCFDECPRAGFDN